MELAKQWLRHERETNPAAGMVVQASLTTSKCAVIVGGKNVTNMVAHGRGPPSMDRWSRCCHCECAPCVVKTQGRDWILEAKSDAPSSPVSGKMMKRMLLEVVMQDYKEELPPFCVKKWAEKVAPPKIDVDGSANWKENLRPFPYLDMPLRCGYCGNKPCSSPEEGRLLDDKLWDMVPLHEDHSRIHCRYILRHWHCEGRVERGCFINWLDETYSLHGEVDYPFDEGLLIPLETKKGGKLEVTLGTIRERERSGEWPLYYQEQGLL